MNMQVKDWQKIVIVDKYGAVTDETGKTLRQASVAEYFHAKFGRWLDDPKTRSADDASQEWSPYNESFHIETGCGEHCKVVIDFAKRAIASVDTCESYEQNAQAIIRVCEETVLEFVYG